MPSVTLATFPGGWVSIQPLLPLPSRCLCSPAHAAVTDGLALQCFINLCHHRKSPKQPHCCFPQPTGMESLPGVIFSQDGSRQSPQLNSPLQQQSHPELSLPSDRDGIKGFCSQRAQPSSAHPCQCLATATELLKLCQVSSCHKSLSIPPQQGKEDG